MYLHLPLIFLLRPLSVPRTLPHPLQIRFQRRHTPRGEKPRDNWGLEQKQVGRPGCPWAQTADREPSHSTTNWYRSTKGKLVFMKKDWLLRLSLLNVSWSRENDGLRTTTVEKGHQPFIVDETNTSIFLRLIYWILCKSPKTQPFSMTNLNILLHLRPMHQYSHPSAEPKGKAAAIKLANIKLTASSKGKKNCKKKKVHLMDQSKKDSFEWASTTATPAFQIKCLFNKWSITKPRERRTVRKKLLRFVDLYPKEIPNAQPSLAQHGDLLRKHWVIPKKRECSLLQSNVIKKY